MIATPSPRALSPPDRLKSRARPGRDVHGDHPEQRLSTAWAVKRVLHSVSRHMVKLKQLDGYYRREQGGADNDCSANVARECLVTFGSSGGVERWWFFTPCTRRPHPLPAAPRASGLTSPHDAHRCALGVRRVQDLDGEPCVSRRVPAVPRQRGGRRERAADLRMDVRRTQRRCQRLNVL